MNMDLIKRDPWRTASAFVKQALFLFQKHRFLPLEATGER